ncbi:MAG TPA: pyruvate kinase, partial [Geobacteraceae bacterium]
LTRDMAPGQGAVYDSHGRLVSPASVGCSLPEVFADVRPGERIWLDDGMIGGIIRSVNADRIVVEITLTRPGGAKLRAEKGINLPDSRLSLSALTAKDLEDLRFVVRHAHMVGMSFIQDVADIYALQEELDRLEAPNLGVVLKIETRRGFEMLPDLLLAAMRRPAVGVMIARGDLAVECGYERLSEVQEEILWLSEAAHVPVIWATQVLDSLAKSGLPSRAEITDAAMGSRAECVMLNKGPHITSAIKVLDNILQRMEEHVTKKSALLRQLRWWERSHSHCITPPADS